MPQGLRRARSARGSFAQTETPRYSPQTLSIYSLNVPFAIAVSLHILIDKPPSVSLSSWATKCLSRATDEMKTSQHSILHFHIKTTSLLKTALLLLLFVFDTNKWIKATAHWSQTAGFEIISNQYTSSKEFREVQTEQNVLKIVFKCLFLQSSTHPNRAPNFSSQISSAPNQALSWHPNVLCPASYFYINNSVCPLLLPLGFPPSPNSPMGCPQAASFSFQRL